MIWATASAAVRPDQMKARIIEARIEKSEISAEMDCGDRKADGQRDEGALDPMRPFDCRHADAH
jgi:hypothetical protein